MNREQMYHHLVAKAVANFQAEIARIPSMIDAEIQKEEDRRIVSQSILQQKAEKLAFQERCTHHHPAFNGNDTHLALVYANDPLPEHLYCMKCEKRVYQDDPNYTVWRAESEAAMKKALEELNSRPAMEGEELELYKRLDPGMNEIKELAPEEKK